MKMNIDNECIFTVLSLSKICVRLKAQCIKHYKSTQPNLHYTALYPSLFCTCIHTYTQSLYPPPPHHPPPQVITDEDVCSIWKTKKERWETNSTHTDSNTYKRVTVAQRKQKQKQMFRDVFSCERKLHFWSTQVKWNWQWHYPISVYVIIMWLVCVLL